jgi:hypothetical protein
MKYFSISIFLISFLMGIIFIYLSKPELKIVKISPTPDNCNHTLYQDKTETCYKYEAKETPCKKNTSFFSIQN